MKEEKRDGNFPSPIKKASIYDGIRLSKKSADTIVFLLSLALVIIISAAIILAGALG